MSRRHTKRAVRVCRLIDIDYRSYVFICKCLGEISFFSVRVSKVGFKIILNYDHEFVILKRLHSFILFFSNE